MNLKKLTPNSIGLLQAIGVIIYCSIIAGFFYLMEKISPEPPMMMTGVALMLFLFVFSAAVTGLLVFGYPAYLAINKNVKEALRVLGFTFLYSLLIIIIILTLAVL
jgi:hypothetical protein